MLVWGITQVGTRLERRSRKGMDSHRSQRQRRNLHHLHPDPHASLGTRANSQEIEENRQERRPPRERDRFVVPLPLVFSVGARIHECKELCRYFVRSFGDWFKDGVRRH